MQPNSEVIQKLSQKADDAEKKARWWDNVAKAFLAVWVGGLSLNIFSQIFLKKKLFRGFGGYDESIIHPVEGAAMAGMATTFLIGGAKHNRAGAFQESIAEIQKTQDTPPTAPKDAGAAWQEKITVPDNTSPSIKQ